MSGEPPAAEGANLSLVDAHQHFQDIGRHYYPWLCDRDGRPRLEGDIGPIRRNYLPADYAGDTAGFDVRKTVHVQNGWDPADPVGETRWLQQLSAETGRPTAIVAFADLSAPGVEGVLDAPAPALRGIRQILNRHADPALRVAAWAGAMARLVQAPNVVAKLSGFGLGHPGWTFADTAPLLQRVLAAFGPDRVMVGTNLPVDRLFAPGRAILGAISALATGLSEAERRAVLSGTAERVYRI